MKSKIKAKPKYLRIALDPQLHKLVKAVCVEQDITIQELILRLIKKEMDVVDDRAT